MRIRNARAHSAIAAATALVMIIALAGCSSACSTPGAWIGSDDARLQVDLDAAPHVVISTELGDITIAVFVDAAPITAANFMRYVDDQRIEDAAFYRVVTMDNQPRNDIKIEVIQGRFVPFSSELSLDPIEHETTRDTGVRHLDGVLSMARSRPGTASSEFFICIGDQPELDFGGRRNPDGQGFAAFAGVVDGMDVVRAIQQTPGPPDGGQYLATPVPITSITRADR